MKIDVLNTQGQNTGRSVDLPESIFGIEPNTHVIYLAVKEYLANQRQGTHDSTERGDVHRTTKKFKRQKGTGGARAGSLKNPMFKGGGRAFGPHPRDYSQKLNKKVKVLARKSALSQLLTNNKIKVVEDFSFAKPKTSEFLNILKNLGLSTSKTLVVTPDHNETTFLSGRNLAKTKLKVAADLSTYEMLNCQTLLLTESSIQKITETLS
ncbi:MAG: 50S ribosomal protein L4 [Saprospiraceae bacterium]|nr:50S ribosomal protein L4 [Candidatus Vicinibacter affinis]MBP6172126.1 50S ribosomal protein L4 [Saprospiraceae bacterium]MBK7304922.1 50S ribosomal protein L4 [Candidatus Vicinibacter affinis]MBK7694687.1 50S ribosomal protein L4 [Candidatus Vicinibacter affinis]MBK7799666.1 50S ribosomal protein L4 [Candidatus Vicinibacter affinis]